METKEPEPPSTSFPQSVGPYRLERSIGEGGMGEVFLGHDTRLDRPVALKRVKADAVDSGRARDRFRREARSLARVRHPAVVEVYDWIEGEHEDWLVMEHLEGSSLRTAIQRGDLEPQQALSLARNMAQGLAAIHAHGIVHRDLKPDNVMMLGPDRVKLLDFGLAKRVESMDGLTLTETISKQGQLLGTVRFMSPEQATGQTLDARSDLFSLGVLLYEMLTGLSPFQGDNAVETLTRICTSAETPVRQLEPSIPEAVSELVQRLLKKEPKLRFQSAEETVEVLDALISGLAGGRSETELRATLPSVQDDGDTDSATVVVEHTSSVSSASMTGAQVRTLLLNDLVDSTKLVERLGDERAASIFEQHDRLARALLQQHHGREIDKSDGFLMLFDRPIDAVRFALGYHAALDQISAQEGEVIGSRVGIHVGEVMLRPNTAEDVARGAKPLEVEGLAKAMAARFMSLAGSGQTLISRGVYDLARRSAVGATDLPNDLRWLEHGHYDIKGVAEPVEVFEVGIEGASPLVAPRDTQKARRSNRDQKRSVWKWAAAAAACLSILVAAGLAWQWNRLDPMDVAVLMPTPGSIDDTVSAALIGGAIRGALVHRLTTLEGIALSPSLEADELEGPAHELAQLLAVDEVVTAGFDCQAYICQIRLSRVAADGGDVIWGGSFSARADDLLQLHNAVDQNFRRGYGNRKVRSNASDLEVKASDYLEFLTLWSEVAFKASERSVDEILARLQALQASSPRFMNAYLLEAHIAAREFADTRDQRFRKLALAAFERSHALAPQNPLPLFALAEFAGHTGDMEQLASAIESLQALAGGHPRVQALEALVIEQNGQTEEALARMRQATEILPSLRLKRHLSMMEYRRGNTEQARKLFEEVLTLRPDDLDVHLNLANLELMVGDPARAADLFQKLVEQSPDVGRLMNLGVAHMLQKRWMDAERAFEKALDLAPGLPGLLLNLADTELLVGDSESATARYRSVVQLVDENPSSAGGARWQDLTVKGQALAHLGENRKAVAAAQEAQRLAGDNPQVAVEVAVIYALVGERSSAIVSIQRALDAGVDKRWFSFPWFDELRADSDLRDLFEAP